MPPTAITAANIDRVFSAMTKPLTRRALVGFNTMSQTYNRVLQTKRFVNIPDVKVAGGVTTFSIGQDYGADGKALTKTNTQLSINSRNSKAVEVALDDITDDNIPYLEKVRRDIEFDLKKGFDSAIVDELETLPTSQLNSRGDNANKILANGTVVSATGTDARRFIPDLVREAVYEFEVADMIAPAGMQDPDTGNVSERVTAWFPPRLINLWLGYLEETAQTSDMSRDRAAQGGIFSDAVYRGTYQGIVDIFTSTAIPAPTNNGTSHKWRFYVYLPEVIEVAMRPITFYTAGPEITGGDYIRVRGTLKAGSELVNSGRGIECEISTGTG